MTDTDMTWGGDAGNVQLVHNGAAYVLNESGLVTKFDLTAGTAQTRQLDLQEYYTVSWKAQGRTAGSL